MTEISEQNTRNGWTPELVEWVETRYPQYKGVYYQYPLIVNKAAGILKQNRPRYGVRFEDLQPHLAELIRALPVDALEVFVGWGWVNVISAVTLAASPSMVVRVKKRWEVGEYVEDEPQPEPEQADRQGEAVMKTIQDLISDALKHNNYAAWAARPDPYGALDPLVGHPPTAYEMFRREMVAAIAQVLKLPDTKTPKGEDEIKTLHDLIAHALKDYGYDGVVNPALECGCRNGALMPCDGYCIDECRPGYLGPPDEDARLDGADWCIYATREARDQAIAAAKSTGETEPETSDPNGYAVEWLRQVAQGCNGGEDALEVNAPIIVAELDRLKADLAEATVQLDQTHQPAANYELLLAYLAGEEVDPGDCPVYAEIQRLRGAIDQLKDEIGAWNRALDRSCYDISPCGECGLPVVCLPDGLPLCDDCGREHNGEVE